MFILLPYGLLGSPSEFATPSYYPPIVGTYNTYYVLHGTALIEPLDGTTVNYSLLQGPASSYLPLNGTPNTYPIIRG